MDYAQLIAAMTRDEMYRIYTQAIERHTFVYRMGRAEFDRSVEHNKVWFIRTLRVRKVPMTFEGLQRINAGPDGSPMNKHRCALYLKELIAEGRVLEEQQSDGVDLYRPTNGA